MAKKKLMAKRAVRGDDDPRKYLVTLHGAPSAVVEAHSQDDAIGAYRKLCGIRSSDHEFRARALGPGDKIKVDEHGIVIDRSHSEVPEGVDPEGDPDIEQEIAEGLEELHGGSEDE